MTPPNQSDGRSVRQAVAITSPPLLDVVDLHVNFNIRGTALKAVDGVSFSVHPGESVGLVGESGSGKSVTALSILKLVPAPGSIVGGHVRFQNMDLAGANRQTLNRVRGRQIGYVFQDASTALNPMLSVGQQLEEGIRYHLSISRRAARDRATDLLAQVGIPEPKWSLSRYPHEMSGGMRQRVMIAIAVSCEPNLIIADEPTSALDVTIQAQILELLESMVDRMKLALLLITHDLGVVAGSTSRLLVMYAGRIVEEGPTARVFSSPQHPYTAGLLKSIPQISDDPSIELIPIRGAPPDPWTERSGCSFRPRCDYSEDICVDRDPFLEPAGDDRTAACWIKPWLTNG